MNPNQQPDSECIGLGQHSVDRGLELAVHQYHKDREGLSNRQGESSVFEATVRIQNALLSLCTADRRL